MERKPTVKVHLSIFAPLLDAFVDLFQASTLYPSGKAMLFF